MMKYLPDTNIFIKASKGCLPEANFLSKTVQKRQILISPITIGEFLVNADIEEEKSFEELISHLDTLPISLDVARIAAKYRKNSLKSTKVHLLDCFLAAQAKIHNLTLVTNNKADFPMKDIKIISP